MCSSDLGGCAQSGMGFFWRDLRRRWSEGVREMMQSMRLIYTGSFGVSGSGRVGLVHIYSRGHFIFFLFLQGNRSHLLHLIPIPFGTKSNNFWDVTSFLFNKYIVATIFFIKIKPYSAFMYHMITCVFSFVAIWLITLIGLVFSGIQCHLNNYLDK